MSDPAHPAQVSPPALGSGPLGSPSAIPTPDIGTSTPTSPAMSDASTVPVTECDLSDVVTWTQMGEGSGWSFIAIPLSRSSSILAPDRTSANQPVPTPDPSEPILLPSTRVEASCLVDQATLNAAIDLIYVRLNLQQTVVDLYQSMKAALERQMIQNRQLGEDLQDLRTSAPPFVQFVQSKYDR
ncbi:unnamed protein product [Hyaloperonospora brassicae]|uniref:Uncharacterized protein n=1 Tax=Hyaloperonospora brassicae TaxID=162125 RepID=A0AAV0ULJ5_HYABA|nr:unnamed protein product [Hyaloperonospora brassicae]